MIQNALYFSDDNFEFDDNVSDDDPFCNVDGDQPTMFDIDFYKPTKLDDNHYHHAGWNYDSEKFLL